MTLSPWFQRCFYPVAPLLLTITPIVSAQTQTLPATGSGHWLYQLGGRDPYLSISRSNNTHIPIEAGADWSIGNVCGFDPKVAFKQQFEEAEDALHNLGRDILTSAIPLARAAVLSELRNINPGLYDTITKGILEAKEQINVSIKSCEQLNADVETGQSPIDGWIKVANRFEWKNGANNGASPVRVRQDILRSGGDGGLTWVGGESAGGVGQPPIELISDTVSVGYRHWDDGNPSSVLRSAFANSEAAQQWITDVVGEKVIRTCTDCTKISTRVGQGLRVQFAEAREHTFNTLTQILEAPDTDLARPSELNVPGMGMVVNAAVIEALADEDAAERELLANRLASELALGRTLEKAIVARSLLRSGQQDPNILANGEALADLSRKQALLDDEIQDILFEQQIRQRLTETPQLLLTRAAQHSARFQVPQKNSLKIEEHSDPDQ